MPLSENLSHKENEFVKSARVLNTQENTVIVATEEGRQILRLLAPYGIFSIPPVGVETFFLDSLPQGACLGVAVPDQEMKAGEILIRSSGGAFILLKNSGEVVINGLVISPSGTI